MNYEDFEKALRYYESTPYEAVYVKCRERVRQNWSQPTLELAGVIIAFLSGFGCHTKDTGTLRQAIVNALRELSSHIEVLQKFSIEDHDLRNVTQVGGRTMELNEASLFLFQRFWAIDHIGHVSTAKTLHLLCPQLLVMWDTKTKSKLCCGGFGSPDRDYVYSYLPRVQKDIQKLIADVATHFGCTRPEAAEKLRAIPTNRKSLAKLADEYYWARYTRGIFGASGGECSGTA